MLASKGNGSAIFNNTALNGSVCVAEPH